MTKTAPDAETQTIRRTINLLTALDAGAQARVLDYLRARFPERQPTEPAS